MTNERTRVRVRRELDIDVTKASPETPFPYFTVVTASGGATAPLDFTVEYLRIDKQIFTLPHDLMVDHSPSGDKIELRLKVPLVGRLNHHVERRTVSKLTLADDPSFFFEALHYTASVDVAVHLREPDIGVIFSEIGTSVSYDTYQPPNEAGDVEARGWHTDRLLFPGQGFMLIFTKKDGVRNVAS